MKRELSGILFGILFLFLPVSGYAATYYVSPTGNDASAGSSSAPWRTLQHAANTVIAGDTVMIKNGAYAGFRAQSSGSPGLPITFKSETGASVVVNDTVPNAWHGSIIEIEEYDWWVIDGLEVTGAPDNAGIDIREAEHVTVRNCYCHHNRKWGIFTGFAEYFTAEYNECSNSYIEHGIYHSNSGDNAIIRYNTCHHNNACGIQINADPWTEKGDHISSNCTVSHNVLYENGNAGGAAINLASVRDSLIANNLIYSNHAGGIAAWDDDAGTQWGSKNNKYYNNTVHMPSYGRWAINLKNGSTDCKVYNNILIHENSARGGLEIDTSSLTGFLSDYNILAQVMVCIDEEETTMSLVAWQSTYARDAHSFSQTAGQTFLSPGSDYHLLVTALAIDAGSTLPEITDDLDGNARPQGTAYDIGAYEYLSPPCPPCSGDEVNLTNITFPAGIPCECIGTISITIGAGVTVPNGAIVAFRAPIVYVNPGFHAEEGSTVSIKQE
jgi:hypothetical protein